MNVKAWLARHWHTVKNLEDSPRAVAVGVASGVFFGFTPLTGLKTLLAIAAAWIFRGSRVAAAVAASLHDVLLPVMPVILRWEYDLGYWILSHPHAWPPSLQLSGELHLAEWLHWSTVVNVGGPLLVGSLFVSLPMGVLSYVFVRKGLERRLARAKAALPLTAAVS